MEGQIPEELTLEKAKAIIGQDSQWKRKSREKIAKLFFYTPGKYKTLNKRFSDRELEKIRLLSQKNVRTIIRAYLDLHPEKTLDDLEVKDIHHISPHILYVPFGIPERKHLLLNKAFPDEYGVLNEQKVVKFLQASFRERKILSRAYFGEREYDFSFYSEAELKMLKKKAFQNAKLLIEVYLRIHLEKTLETLTSQELSNISTLMIKAVTGSHHASKIFRNRLFRGKYGLLSERSALQLLRVEDREKFRLSLVYFDVLDEDDPETKFCSPEERQEIYNRSIKNAKLLISVYLRLHPEKSLEMLTAEDIGNMSTGMYKLASSTTKNLRLLLTKLFPDKYAVLDKQKYLQFMDLEGQEKANLSEVYFHPHPGEIDTEEDRAFIIERSRTNAKKAVEYYMEINGINDVNEVGSESLRQIYLYLYKLFNVPYRYPQLLLERMFPKRFGRFIHQTLEAYIQKQRKPQTAVNYFRIGKMRVNGGLEVRLSTVKRNALLTFLYFCRNYNISLLSLKREHGQIIPASIFRVFGLGYKSYGQLGEILKQEFQQIDLNPQIFFWRNLVNLVDDPVIFFDLAKPNNLDLFGDAEEEMVVEIARKIFQNPYPYYSPEKNKRVSQTKIQLLKRILYRRPIPLKDINSEIQEKLVSCFIEGIHDQYLTVQNQCWILLAETRRLYPFLMPKVMRKVLLKGWFSHERMLQALEKAKVSLKDYSDFLKNLDTMIIRVVEELSRLKNFLLKEGVIKKEILPSKVEKPRSHEEYVRLVRGLKDNLKSFSQHFSVNAEIHLSVVKILVGHRIDFVREEALKILENQLQKLPLKAKISLIDLVPNLLLSPEESDRAVGVKIVKETRSYLAVLSPEERFVLEQTLLTTRDKLSNL